MSLVRISPRYTAKRNCIFVIPLSASASFHRSNFPKSIKPRFCCSLRMRDRTGEDSLVTSVAGMCSDTLDAISLHTLPQYVRYFCPRLRGYTRINFLQYAHFLTMDLLNSFLRRRTSFTRTTDVPPRCTSSAFLISQVSLQPISFDASHVDTHPDGRRDCLPCINKICLTLSREIPKQSPIP